MVQGALRRFERRLHWCCRNRTLRCDSLSQTKCAGTHGRDRVLDVHHRYGNRGHDLHNRRRQMAQFAQ